MAYSPIGDSDFFDFAKELQGYIFALFLFIICIEYELGTLIDQIKDMGFTYKNSKTQTVSSSNYHGYLLRRWSSTSRQYTCPSNIFTGSHETNCQKHWPLHNLTFYDHFSFKSYIYIYIYIKKSWKQTTSWKNWGIYYIDVELFGSNNLPSDVKLMKNIVKIAMDFLFSSNIHSHLNKIFHEFKIQ